MHVWPRSCFVSLIYRISGLSAFLFAFRRIGRFSQPTVLQIDEEMIQEVLSYKAYIKQFYNGFELRREK